ncbi:ATP-binding protein [Polaromonas sp. UC242_47]|uniref:ATP-binding protein n=1 Tax=Polaromonas sp. UC242_47 TaxID=3374626 RepID=UPI00379FDB3B
MKFSFLTKINLALGAGLAILLLIGVGAYTTINALLDDARSESDLHDTVLLLEQVVSQLKTTEAWQHGDLLTVNTSDGKAYQRAHFAVKPALTEARAAVANTPWLRPWPEIPMAQRLEAMAQALRSRPKSGLQTASMLVDSDANRQLLEKLDHLVERIKTSESLALQRSRETNQRSAQTIKLLLLAGGLLSLGLLVWAIVVINRYEARRRRVEAQLSDSVAMSRAVTESMAEGVITATADGRIANVNAAGLKLFGYRLPELLGRPVTQLIPARHHPAFEVFFNSLLSRPEGFKVSGRETRGVNKNGDEMALQVSFGNVTVDGKRLFTAIVFDITQTQRISDALHASESQLRQMSDTVPALLAYVDAEQRLQFHNKAYEESFDRTRDQIHGKHLREVLGDTFYQKVSDKIEEALSGRSVRYEEARINAQGELRNYDITYLPRYGEGEQQGLVMGYYALGNDITEFKRIDRMKSEFVSTVSHELRTPLTSIRGSLGLISGGVAGVLPDKAQKLVDIAKDNCERLIRLINTILDSEKIESGKMHFALQVTALQPLLAQALAANEGFAAQHQVTLALDAPDSRLHAHIDSDCLMQVITNLLSNAVKFSPPQTPVQLRLLRVGERVRVEVIDQGSGIPEAFRKRIFQKFSQADSSDARQNDGTGLGLSISRAIVERMGGRMGFSSEPGQGTVFFFELPECHAVAGLDTNTTPIAPSYTAPRPRILVCENNSEVAGLLGTLLDQGGFDVDRVDSAAQALELLTIQAYAAMTLSPQRPDQAGGALIRALRGEKYTHHLPIVLLSAMARQGQLHFSQQPLLVSGWLEKPMDENRLLLGLRRAIAGIAGNKPRLLHVAGDQDIQRITAALSQDLGTFESAATLDQARTHLRTGQVGAVLLDLDLGPGAISGAELLAELAPSPPVLIFSASDVSAVHQERRIALLLKTTRSEAEMKATPAPVLARPTPRQPHH